MKTITKQKLDEVVAILTVCPLAPGSQAALLMTVLTTLKYIPCKVENAVATSIAVSIMQSHPEGDEIAELLADVFEGVKKA